MTIDRPTDRDAAITEIRANLRRRTGRAWSVTGGRGTSWGWITITAPPARRTPYGSMDGADAKALGDALGLPGQVHHQGVMVPASGAYRDEYISRARGETPAKLGTPYWD